MFAGFIDISHFYELESCHGNHVNKAREMMLEWGHFEVSVIFNAGHSLLYAPTLPPAGTYKFYVLIHVFS
jgi:hypothetical protein